MQGSSSSEIESKGGPDTVAEREAEGHLDLASGISLHRKLRALLLGRSRTVMLGVGAVCAVVVLAAWMVDEGEVVKLLTRDARLHAHETELWIADLDSGSYLRASTPDAAWLVRMRANPVVTVIRDGVQHQHRVVIVEDGVVLEELNRAMDSKYGFADRMWERLSDRSAAVAIRLDSLDADADALADD